MPGRARQPKSLSQTIAAALFFTTTSLNPSVLSTEERVPDVSGDWTWEEAVIFIAPGYIVAAFFGVQVEGPIMHLRCQTGGGLTIQQNGASFSGSADQQWACVTRGGQPTPTAPFPPAFDVSGSITGHAVHFSADIGQGFSCSYAGSLSVVNGVATSINATGGCDVPLPVHPNMDKSVSFDATRQ